MAILFVKTGGRQSFGKPFGARGREPCMPHLRAYSEAEDEVREMTGGYMAQQYESTLRYTVPQGASVLS